MSFELNSVVYCTLLYFLSFGLIYYLGPSPPHGLYLRKGRIKQLIIIVDKWLPDTFSTEVIDR